jgi:hypothetical protein
MALDLDRAAGRHRLVGENAEGPGWRGSPGVVPVATTRVARRSILRASGGTPFLVTELVHLWLGDGTARQGNPEASGDGGLGDVGWTARGADRWPLVTMTGLGGMGQPCP